MKTEGLSRQVMTETPSRVLAFLRGVRTGSELQLKLAKAGYTAAHHEEGIRLLTDALRLAPDALAPERGEEEEVRARAQAAMESVARIDLRRARAALGRRHPDHEAVVFGRVAEAERMGKGNAALTVRMFLDMLSLLETKDPFEGSQLTAEANREALATLADRGFSPALRAEWLALSKVALGETPNAPRPEPKFDDEPAMLALRGWYAEWAETARAVLSSRVDLIRLGLAQRKRASDSSQDDGD